jgi:transposase InsO family protein
MAKLIPNYDPAAIENAPERKVAEVLCAQLPKDVRVFHSYPWMRKERDLDKAWQGEVIREGEADFVIVDPRYGIMVLEVKGGQMLYDAVMDWNSRKVLGWALSNTMGTDLCLEALEMALGSTGKVPEIFNTDQGCQFTSAEWTGRLTDLGVKISMDGKGRWMDNVFIERLWRSVKYERI